MAPRTSHQPHLKATQKPQQLAGMEVPPAVRMERMKGGVEVAVNLEAAGHIRSGDAELPGGGEHEPNRLGRAHLERGERIPRPGRAPVIGPKRNRGIVINERPKDIPEVSSAPQPRLTAQSVAVRSDGRPHAPPGQKVAPHDGYSTPAINQPFEGAVRDLPSASFSTDAGRCTTRLDLRACARGNQRIRLARRVRTRSRWRPSVIAAPATIITTIGSEHDQCSECLGGFSEAGRDAEIGVVAQDTAGWRPARAATPILTLI